MLILASFGVYMVGRLWRDDGCQGGNVGCVQQVANVIAVQRSRGACGFLSQARLRVSVAKDLESWLQHIHVETILMPWRKVGVSYSP
jgi:hypothetical protein